MSPLWNARQKLLGALVWPGGLLMVGAFPFLFAARSETCVSSGTAVQVCEPGQVCPVSPILDSCAGSGIQWGLVLLAVVLVLAPIVVAAYLWRAAGRRSATTASRAGPASPPPPPTRRRRRAPPGPGAALAASRPAMSSGSAS